MGNREKLALGVTSTARVYSPRVRRALRLYGVEKCCKAYYWRLQGYQYERDTAHALDLTINQLSAAAHAGEVISDGWTLTRLQVMAGIKP